MHYWLMKSEPSTFAISDLQQRPAQRESWDGVRNYQVRNMMRDKMQVGDKAFFYHSSCKVPGIVGTMEIVSAAYPDATAFDPASSSYDSTSDPSQPRWLAVDVKLVRVFAQIIPLTELRAWPELANLLILQKGNRLSVTPITAAEWHFINKLDESLSLGGR